MYLVIVSVIATQVEPLEGDPFVPALPSMSLGYTSPKSIQLNSLSSSCNKLVREVEVGMIEKLVGDESRLGYNSR